MFSKTLVVLAVLATATALPLEKVAAVENVVEEQAASLTAPAAYGVDVVQSLSNQAAQCLSRNYAAQFFRIYAAGSTDSTGVRNAKTYAACKFYTNFIFVLDLIDFNHNHLYSFLQTILS